MKVFLSALVFLLGYAGISQAQPIHTCTEMPLSTIALQQAQQQIPEAASRAVSYKPKYGLYWSNGSTIKVKLIGGSNYVRDRVRHYANMWTQYANLNFEFVNSGRSDIRVSFVQNGSSWSVIGKQALRMRSNEATMNFGWLNDRTPEYEFRRTILHEFGHALGLLHEHQNPSGGIPWDEAAVYSHYRASQGWSPQTTYANVIKKASRNATQFSNYDPHSIMHYPVSPRLTNGQYQVGINKVLSPIDKAFIQQIYPGRSSSSPDNGPIADSGNRPRPPVTRPKPRPAAGERFIVKVNNKLGESQVSEKIDLYLGGDKYTFDLDANGQRQQGFRFRMKRGKYNYRLESASTYQFTRKVWNGQQYVRRKIERTIYGGGEGSLEVNSGATYTLYGDYDKNTKRMRVYLGEVNGKPNGLANVRNEIACEN